MIYFGACDEDEDCENATGFDFVCITNACVQACADQEECNDFSAIFFDHVCFGGLCLAED
jgi:hypothetical protein